MLEHISTLISSAGVGLSFLSIFWIWRKTHKISSSHNLFALVIFIFSLWQWYSFCLNPPAGLDIIISTLFSMLAAGMNAFYAGYQKVEVNLNRRKRQINISHPDRRRQLS